MFVNFSNYFHDRDADFAGLLVEPVGAQLNPEEGPIMSALLSLKSLTAHGVEHGDPRVYNVIWFQESALWLDLRLAREIGQKEKAPALFAAGVKTFAGSFEIEVKLNYPAIEEAALHFFNTGDDTNLRSLLRPLWISQGHYKRYYQKQHKAQSSRGGTLSTQGGSFST